MDIKKQVEALILEGEKIIRTAYSTGLYGSIYYSGEDYEEWISKCSIIMDKYFKESNLYERFIVASKSAVGNGKEYYDTMIGVLKAISKEDVSFLEQDIIKKKKIFVSHSSKNKKVTDKFVELLKNMGVKNEQLYYSSYEETGVDFLQDCFQRINEEFNGNDLLVIFMISREFYSSKVCVAEMGATWVTAGNKYIPIIIPPYSYSNVEGVINATQAGITLNDVNVSSKIEKLKEDIEVFLEIENKVNAVEWNRKKDDFLDYINVLESELNEVEGKLWDVRLDAKHSETDIMFKIGLVNNTRNRMKLEEVKINLKIGEGHEEISLSDWNVQALVVQPLEEITVYLPTTIGKIVKRSQIKVNESEVSLSYYEEN